MFDALTRENLGEIVDLLVAVAAVSSCVIVALT